MDEGPRLSFLEPYPFLTRELRTCARRVIDMMWGIAFARSLARSIGRFL